MNIDELKEALKQVSDIEKNVLDKVETDVNYLKDSINGIVDTLKSAQEELDEVFEGNIQSTVKNFVDQSLNTFSSFKESISYISQELSDKIVKYAVEEAI